MQSKRSYSPPKPQAPYGSQPKRQTPAPLAIRSMPNPHKVLAARVVPPAAAGAPRAAHDVPSRLPQPMPVRELPRFGSKPAAASVSPARHVIPPSPPQQELESLGISCSRLGSNYKMVLGRNDTRASNLLQLTCTIDTLLVGSVGKGIMEVFGTVAEIISRPKAGNNELAWEFAVQDHTIPGTVLPVIYQPVGDVEVTTGGTFRMIGNMVVSKDTKKFACVWLERLGHDLREYQFTRTLLNNARLNANES